MDEQGTIHADCRDLCPAVERIGINRVDDL